MRAVRFHELGGPELLRLEEVPEPVRGAGEVLIAVEAAGLNPADSKRREGRYGAPPPLPAGTGREVAGRVLEADASGPFAPGDRVVGTGEGILGERVALPVAAVASYPVELDPRIAACLPVAAQTAAAEIAAYAPGSGDTVLVSAAAGGVGIVAVQLAVAAGARVLGTASPANHDLLRELGAEPIAYGPGLADRLRAAAPEGLTLVLDHHGAETLDVARELGVPPERVNTTAAKGQGLGVGEVGREGMDRRHIDALATAIVAGRLRIPIAATYPLDGVVEAYRLLDDGHVVGKVVVTL